MPSTTYSTSPSSSPFQRDRGKAHHTAIFFLQISAAAPSGEGGGEGGEVLSQGDLVGAICKGMKSEDEEEVVDSQSPRLCLIPLPLSLFFTRYLGGHARKKNP